MNSHSSEFHQIAISDMPKPVKKSGRVDHFKHFRLLVAREILGNSKYLNAYLLDIETHAHICELLDAYAIQVLFEWIVTTIGCNRYASYAETENAESVETLIKSVQNLRLYPFLDTDRELISKQLRQSADRLLTDAFVPAPELLGAVYEHICNRPLAIGKDLEIVVTPDIQLTDKRRIVGQFYTPSHIVEYCFERVMEADSIKFMNALNSCSKWRMLDPACGTGNFLVGAINLAERNGAKAEAIYRLASECIYGFELDGKAASLARLQVLLAVIKIGACSMANVDALNELMSHLTKNIRVTDSVLLASNGAYAEQNELDQFDLVIGNPPYVSFGSRNQPDLSATQSLFFRNEYPEGAEYKIRLHSIFQDVAIRLCKPDGTVSLLIPDSFLTGSFYSKLREFLLSKIQIVSLSELPESTIPGAVVGRWCVAQYRVPCEHNGLRGQYHGSDAPQARSGEHNGSGELQNRRTLDYKVVLRSECGSESVRYEASIQSLISSRTKIRLLFNETDEQILLLLNGLPNVASVLRGHTGLRSKVGQKSIIANTQLGPTWEKGIQSGSSVIAHSVDWDGNWLNIDRKILYAGGFDPAVIKNPKLLVRQTGDRLTSAVDESGLFHLNNVHSFSSAKLATNKIHNHSTIDLYYACALLNSSMFLYLYQLNTREQNRALAQIDIETVEALPIPRADALSSNLLSRLSRIAHQFRKNIDTQAGSHFVSTDTNSGSTNSDDAKSPNNRLQLLRCIDRLVYDLFGVNENQIAHIEEYCQQSNSARQKNDMVVPSSIFATELAHRLIEDSYARL